MTNRTTTRARSPAMIRTGHDRAAAPLPAADPRRPARARGFDGDAFGEWMAHVDAARIAVR